LGATWQRRYLPHSRSRGGQRCVFDRLFLFRLGTASFPAQSPTRPDNQTVVHCAVRLPRFRDESPICLQGGKGLEIGTMRRFHLASIAAVFFLAGCANSPYPFAAAPTGQQVAAPPRQVAQSAGDCAQPGSIPFGKSADMSGLSTMMEVAAAQASASQACAWDRSTRVNYGYIATGTIAERTQGGSARAETAAPGNYAWVPPAHDPWRPREERTAAP